MKIYKVLLGLFAGVMALNGGVANAQFYEIGPANIGGQVSSLVLDNQDGTTIYAGATSGGLFLRTTNSDVLNNLYSDLGSTAPIEELVADTTSWHKVTLMLGNEEVTLPVSAMVQLPNGELILGTGDDSYILGSMYTGRMSSKGRGIYRYNPSTKVLSLINFTSNLTNFAAVRKLDYIYRDGVLYFFAATNSGVYRWTVTDANPEAGWSANAVPVQLGDVEDMVLSRTLNIGYFSIGNQLYKISNLMAATPSAYNISASNTAFGGSNTSLKLALAPSNNQYLYVMVINENGESENVYLTTNGQAWTTTTTETIRPIWANNGGKSCGVITVDPSNPKRIIIAGTNIWIGQGYIDGANYQWTKSSYSEWELNRGDYMGSVFINPSFVHSGIHQILPVYSAEPVYQTTTEEIHHTYYIATDGGVYSSSNNFRSFNNINMGMNNIQVADIAVCPDGSVISGAAFNGCPFIGSRTTHDGGSPVISWYDYGTMGNFNHSGNVLWSGSGNKVAASAFYQIAPQSRRNIFVSSNGSIGRSFADYLDFTQTQTWTIDEAFLTSGTNNYTGHVGNIHLWESHNDTYYKDSLKVAIDQLGYYFHNNDTAWINQDSSAYPYKLVAGDRAVFVNRGNAEYPFEFPFTQSFLNKFKAEHGHDATVADTFLVKTPVVSRMMAIVSTNTSYDVIYTWMPNDFSRVTSADADADKRMYWCSIFHCVHGDVMDNDLYPRDAIMSADGRTAYVSTYQTAQHKSQLFRIRGFENVNFYQAYSQINRQLGVDNTSTRLLKQTSISAGGEWFSRPISSITADPRPGQDRIVVTFEDYNDSYENVIIINNASDTNGNCSIEEIGIRGTFGNLNGIPAYSAMIERTTGDIWVGTAEGVFIYKNGTWSQYSHLKGVPVTAVKQQYRELPVRHHLTHTGINPNNFVFAKTKWPGAIYIGTYGRGIFMDTTMVTDTINEISDPEDYLDIPRVSSVGLNNVSVYPNPVSGNAHLSLTAAEAGRATLRIYDLNGRMVTSRDLGYATEGEQVYSISTDGMSKGMYLINVIIGGHTAATKMLVR